MTLNKFVETIKKFQEIYELGSEIYGPWPTEFTFVEWLEECQKWAVECRKLAVESDMSEVIE